MASTAAPSARVLVAAAHPAPGGERGGLGATDELHRQVAIGCLGLSFHGRRLPAGNGRGTGARLAVGWTHACSTAARAAAVGFMPDDEGLALHEAGLDGGRARAAARDRHVLREVGDLPRRGRARRRDACCSPSTTTAARRRTRPGWEHHDDRLVDPRTGRMDTLPFFRRTIEDAGLEDVVVAVIGDSPTVAAHWATPLGLVFIDGGHAFDVALADYEGWSRFVAARRRCSCSTTCSRTRPTAGRRPSTCGSARSPTASRPSRPPAASASSVADRV